MRDNRIKLLDYNAFQTDLHKDGKLTMGEIKEGIVNAGNLKGADLEEAIINSYVSFSSLKLKALSRVERIVSGLASSIINLFREWSPLKIKEIDAYLDQVSGAVEEYKGFVKDECQSIISKIREVSAVIEYLEFHHNFFERFKSILDLKDHERPVCVIPEVKYTGSDFLSSDKGEGLLFFTSERAIFIRREGLLKKMFKRQFSFPLNDVELLVKRGLRRAFILKTGKGKVCFTSSRHVIEKIESYSDVGFAVVLYTPCDKGGKDTDPIDLKSRARQNVVFEHGYLIGKLGRDKVCALVRGSIEIPNDISGVVYLPIDSHGAWKYAIADEMSNAGYDVDKNRIKT